MKPTVIPYEAVSRVERVAPPAFLRYAEALRFRSENDKWDRLYFSSFTDRVDQIVAALRKRGIKVL